MTILRTPDEFFRNLPDYPFSPNYVELNGLRMHYVDEGKGAEVALCLHGEPTWSFLYRKVIPPLAERMRVVAPDLIGFGRSDKLPEESDYSFQMHRDSLISFIESLDLQNVTLICHDWGGILGLPVAMALQERFKRLVILNTGLPTGDIAMGEGFMQWRAFVERVRRELQMSRVIQTSAPNMQLSQDVLDAYDAPFPDVSYKAGAAIFPLLVPLESDDPGAAELRETREKLKTWEKPAFVLFSDSDPVLGGAHRFFRKLIPTASQQPEILIKGAGHFLQEEQGEAVAEQILAFLDRTS